MPPNARQRASKRTARLVLPRRDSQRPGGSAFWHRPQWGGDASWPGHREPSLDLAPVLASPGEKLKQGLGPLTSERPAPEMPAGVAVTAIPKAAGRATAIVHPVPYTGPL